jgi:hypothetical protein
MNKFLIAILGVCAFGLAACSRSNETVVTTASPTPSLQTDADRLHQATANAAKEREKSAQISPTPSPP